MNSTHVGKIARLPKSIREELNRRLENGELGRTILDWVNHLPDTQQILAEHFAGKPISHQNVSEWRRTGYQDWLLQQQRLNWFADLTEQDEEIIQQNRCADSFEAMGNFFLFELGQALTAMQHIKNPEARWTRLQNLTREFARLQNAYNWSRRVMLEWDQYNGNRTSGRKDLPPSPPQNTPPKNYTQPPAAHATKPEPQTLAATSGTRETPQQPLTTLAATQHAVQNPTAPATPAHASTTNVPPPHSAPSNSHPDNALQAIPTPSTTPEPPRPSNFELRTPNSEPPSTPEPPRPYNPPLPQIQHQPPPPPAPKPYRPFSLPIRGRRFVCIEG